ncbi:hypothetical protein BYT27DRAFT_7125474 [Phlegmacium glaucopus]|nr:hypothetical protein BYT27DRAFT_7125474 [Phlegmacium glaucopus]
MEAGELTLLKRTLNSSVVDATKKVSVEDTRLAKRHCMDGLLQMPCVIGVPATIVFTQTLFDTENCVSLLLPFFLNKNICYITDKAATLPIMKSSPLAGETKGINIIDIEKLLVTLGKEGSLTCSQWTEAAFQMFHFQQEDDSEGPDRAFVTWYSDHFNFFNSQLDRDEMYQSWKDVELELHQEFWSQPTNFDAAHYVAKYELAKSESQILARFESMGKTSLPPCCILCGQRGHNIFQHSDDSVTAKFSEGKSTWAKFINHILHAPDNYEICIKFNIKGKCSECNHPKYKCAHICSFCRKSHFAFSWTCHAYPADN